MAYTYSIAGRFKWFFSYSGAAVDKICGLRSTAAATTTSAFVAFESRSLAAVQRAAAY